MIKLAENVGLKYSENANWEELNCILIKVRFCITIILFYFFELAACLRSSLQSFAACFSRGELMI